DELRRHRRRLELAREDMRVGKISGAVGTHAHVPPDVEEEACTELGLVAAPASTQIIQRDRHAFFLSVLAGIGSTIDKFAVEIRHLARTEVREAEEPFKKGNQGSSAMPHKRNPILCERIAGLARVLRANAHAAFENVALWHERDISHSSVERVILPDSLILVDYLIDRLAFVLDGLRVFPDRMRANLEGSGGLVYSQRVLLALTEALGSREAAYQVVQSNAMQVWEEGGSLEQRLAADASVQQHLSANQLAELFDPQYYLRNLEGVYQRSLARAWEEG
ncbi:MAG: adenylosuccinate lyase, partial [Candidatus Eisenbacteria bacterium]|nr:adenylosuccinate lyase [Candidatus Eisenbacteria bacterium]